MNDVNRARENKSMLHRPQVADDKGVAVSCPKTSLGMDESMVCTGTGPVS